MAFSWAVKDPEAAANWAQQVRNEELRKLAVSVISTQCAHSDLPGLEQWIAGLPNSPEPSTASEILAKLIEAREGEK